MAVRCNRRPSVPFGEGVSARIVARQHDLGVPVDDGFHVDRRRQLANIRKHVAPTAERYQLARVMLATDRVQRAARYLVEHAYRLRIGMGIAEFLQRGSKLRGGFACLLRPTRDRADPRKGCRNVIEVACPDGLDRVAHLPQFIHDVRRRTALPGQQHVGTQQCELLLVDRECVTDEGKRLDRGRIIGISADTHERIAGAGGKHEFGEIRRERNDTRGDRGVCGIRWSVRAFAGEERRQRCDE
jgi:hypothetical protein